MKKISLIILLCFFILQYKNVLAVDKCVANNYPTIYNTKDIHLKVGEGAPNYLLGVYAVDSCDNDYPNINVDDFEISSYNQAGEYSVFYNSKFTTVEITVFIEEDLNTPKFIGLENKQIEVNTTIDLLEGVTAKTRNGESISLEDIKVTDFPNDELKHHIVTYYIEDSNGNILAEQDIYVLVSDTISPLIENTSDLTLEFNSNIDLIDWWKDITVSDNSNLNITKEVDLLSLNINELGVYPITYTATDVAGNETSKSVNVKVVDTIPPVFTNAIDLTFKLSEQLTTYDYLANLEVMDNYDGQITNVLIDKDNVKYDTQGGYTVTYFACDSSANCDKKTIYVIIVDDVKPIINGTDDLYIPIGEHGDFLEGITAYDEVDGDLTDQIQIYDFLVNYDEIGEYTLFYTVYDLSGNEDRVNVTVHILDNEVPQISGVSNISIEVHTNIENYDFIKEITALDNIDGDITNSINVDLSELDNTKLGAYTIYYSVVDSHGNIGVEECQVNVVDTTAPKIIGYNDITIGLNEDVNFFNNITVHDNYDNDLTQELKLKGLYDINKEGEYTITLEVTDSSNNTATVTFKLFVINKDKNQSNQTPTRSSTNSMYYIIGIIGASLIGAGVLGYKTRKRHI